MPTIGEACGADGDLDFDDAGELLICQANTWQRVIGPPPGALGVGLRDQTSEDDD